MSDHKVYKLEKMLNKTIEILGSNTIDICPQQYNLAETGSDCPQHFDCERCWKEALEGMK